MQGVLWVNRSMGQTLRSAGLTLLVKYVTSNLCVLTLTYKHGKVQFTELKFIHNLKSKSCFSQMFFHILLASTSNWVVFLSICREYCRSVGLLIVESMLLTFRVGGMCLYIDVVSS